MNITIISLTFISNPTITKNIFNYFLFFIIFYIYINNAKYFIDIIKSVSKYIF